MDTDVKMFPKIDKFTISRKKWLRGKEKDSVLWDSRRECGCCIGLYGIACGIPAESMDGVDTPWRLLRDKKIAIPDTVGVIRGSHTAGVSRAMEINDAALGSSLGALYRILSPAIREEEIAKYFASIGVEVTFED